MENVAGNIAVRPSWNNLVDLPASVASLLYNANISPQEVIVELVLQTQQKSYVGWSGMNSGGARNVGIDPIFAQSLRLADKQAVVVNVKIRNHKSSSVFLEPEHLLDWELVELHAAYIESKLIEQSRCVAVGQVLVVYPTKTSSVRLQVTDIGTSAVKYALIDPFAEISIAPKLRQPKKPAPASEKSAKSSRSTSDDTGHGPSVLKRGISLPHPLFDGGELRGEITYELFVNRSEFIHVFLRHDYVSVSIVLGPLSKQNRAPTDSSESAAIDGEKSKDSPTPLLECKQVVARLRNSPNVPDNNVGLSLGLAIALGVENKIGYKVLVRQASKHLSKRPSTFVVHPYVTQTKSSKQLNLNSASSKEENANLCKRLSEQLFRERRLCDSPLTNYLKLPIIPGLLPHGGLLVFKRRTEKHVWIKPFEATPKALPKVEVEADLLRSESFVQETQSSTSLDAAYEMESTIDDILDQIAMFKNSGVMIHGSSGSGKSLILKWAARKCHDTFGYHIKQIQCEKLMNESQELLISTLSKAFNEAVWHEPSLIVLDNLDKILSAETENGDSRMSNQITELFISQQRKIAAQAITKVSILVTGASKESFNKQLLQSHLFDLYVHLRAPDKKTRATILEKYTAEHLNSTFEFDVMDVVQETEGYLPNDLKVLSERMYFQSLHSARNKNSSEMLISKTAFEKAHAGYTPSNLRGVKLEKSGTSWLDIGGLTDAKRVLLETLEWPTKYAPIFASCPLRLRSGILLYGYPGCGKTLLASAIAAQCGLNFISIKGPEILNKYIGASEQSVRDLFDRAQAAKPCVLFFDEFDSIAPKRGHDSTGVTDRVVNQMLTQMDGAEGLDGVYVLAATSRPDLIDSALLRPGRLDKSIICDMPNFDDRLLILKCICEKMDLEPNVDLDKIATLTAGFSGADMQGICYNAYLKAVHDKLNLEEQESSGTNKEQAPTHDFFQVSTEKLAKLRPIEQAALRKQIEKIFDNDSDNSKKDEATPAKSSAPTVPINQTHFEISLKETKPSISASEKQKLNRIYSEFLTGRDGNMPDGSASNEIGGRTTLM